MNMQMSVLMISSPHNFHVYINIYTYSIYYLYNFEKFLFFSQTCKNMSPYENKLEQTLFCILFRVDIRQVLLSHSLNMEVSSYL